jgi:hypothetical protein
MTDMHREDRTQVQRKGHAQRGSNPGAEEGNKSLPPLGHDLKCVFFKKRIFEILKGVV